MIVAYLFPCSQWSLRVESGGRKTVNQTDGVLMLATRIHQKDSLFYFISYKATDLLEKVRFTSRYYFEGEEIKGDMLREDDDVARFIAGIERSEKGFQRALNRQKLKQILNFYETVVTQPMVPGTVLLFTDETLRFQKMGDSESVGFLSEPKGKYLIIDGQHRIAGLHFFRERHPDEIARVDVPCVLFDGRSAEFATEMFVIINSTHTRINRSHLVDLYEKVSWESPEKKFAAKVVILLYDESDSPLQYKINRLGGRSKQEKWILQSELFNELHKLVVHHARWLESHLGMKAGNCYALVRDYLKAAKDVMGEVWGNNDRYMFTRDVTLKALIRVLDDLIVDRKLMGQWEQDTSPEPFVSTLRPWAELAKDFRAEGFYERFPAKGQVERVRKIHTRLMDAIIG
ncbi:MAG: DGQHR domain-containing protein [Nitrospiraceae bacterium]